MKTCMLLICFVFTSVFSFAQTIQQRLNNAVQALLKDEQMKHAIMSLYVVEKNTGKVVYNLNEQVGLAPASGWAGEQSPQSFSIDPPSIQGRVKASPAATMRRFEAQVNERRNGLCD